MDFQSPTIAVDGQVHRKYAQVMWWKLAVGLIVSFLTTGTWRIYANCQSSNSIDFT